jgi:hypothetical protein
MISYLSLIVTKSVSVTVLELHAIEKQACGLAQHVLQFWPKFAQEPSLHAQLPAFSR